MRKVVAIVQARVGSTRLPKKVLKRILGKPMLWHVINRLKKAKLIDEIVVATTQREEDELIVRLSDESGVKSFAGSEEDVLDRYYQAAKTHKADVIVRITADCPLIDPHVVDRVVKHFLDGDFDYVSNTCVEPWAACKQTYPDGLDTEVFSFNVLKNAWKEAKMQSEREHVTPYIWKQPDVFKIGRVQYSKDLSHMRWSVDYEKDLRFVREVYRRLYKKGGFFNMEDVLTLLSKYPELMEINSEILINKGYFKSLEKDKMVKTERYKKT